MGLHMFVCLEKYHVSASSADNLYSLSFGNALKATRPDWRHRVWLNIWIRHGDPITPRNASPGRKLAVGPRSVVHGPGSGLRQLHSPSPKSYVRVSGPDALSSVQSASEIDLKNGAVGQSEARALT